MAPRRQFRPLATLLSESDLVRPDELAHALRVSPACIYQWCERQIIPFVRMGKVIRFLPQDIHEFLKAKRRVAVKSPGGGPVKPAT